MSYERHPLSAAWPDMPEEDLFALAADVKKNGLLESIVLLDGKVLDGWHRQQACQMAEIKVRARKFDLNVEGDPVAFVIAKNAFRRQLTQTQRAEAIVACTAWRPHGDQRRSATLPIVSQVAKSVGVSARTITDAKVAHDAGYGEEMRNGSVSASAAARKARQEKRRPTRKPPQRPKGDPRDEEIAKLRAEVADLREKNADLADLAQSYVDISGDDKARAVELQKLHQYIRTLESQRDEWMHKANEFIRECKALRKRLGE